MLPAISELFIFWFQSCWIELQEGDSSTFHQIGDLQQVFELGSEGIPLFFSIFQLWSELPLYLLHITHDFFIQFLNIIWLVLDFLDLLRNLFVFFFYNCVFFADVGIYSKLKVNDNVLVLVLTYYFYQPFFGDEVVD